MKAAILRCGLTSSLLREAGLTISAQESGETPITFDEMIKLTQHCGAEVSPEGKWAAYRVATPRHGGQPQCEQHMACAEAAGAAIA